MKKNDFLEELEELFEIEEKMTLETSLEDMEEYDSLAIMSLIGFLDESFDQTVSGETLASLRTVADLVALVGEENLEN